MSDIARTSHDQPEGASDMTQRTVRRVFRPQGLSAILGMGVLAVAAITIAFGGSAPVFAQLVAAVAGMAGGTTVVLKET